MSAAKGLSEAAGVPIVAVSRLELLAQKHESKGVVWAVLVAGRGEFYAGEYRDGVCLGEGLYTLNALENMVSGVQEMVFCETSQELVLKDFHLVRVEEPGVEDLLNAGMRRLEQGAFDDAATLDANYLWRMEDEILARLAAQAPRGAAG